MNIIINTAQETSVDASLDDAVRVNVSGPLVLLKLAEECKNFEAFCQVSTAYVNADRTGYVEERLYENDYDWEVAYEQILNMNKRKIKENTKGIVGKFPNCYDYSKRMMEHLMVKSNYKRKNLPLVVLRKGIIGDLFSLR